MLYFFYIYLEHTPESFFSVKICVGMSENL